jgi:hypothetical protein
MRSSTARITCLRATTRRRHRVERALPRHRPGRCGGARVQHRHLRRRPPQALHVAQPKVAAGIGHHLRPAHLRQIVLELGRIEPLEQLGMQALRPLRRLGGDAILHRPDHLPARHHPAPRRPRLLRLVELAHHLHGAVHVAHDQVVALGEALLGAAGLLRHRGQPLGAELDRLGQDMLEISIPLCPVGGEGRCGGGGICAHD